MSEETTVPLSGPAVVSKAPQVVGLFLALFAVLAVDTVGQVK